jgi:hypothetical protein
MKWTLFLVLFSLLSFSSLKATCTFSGKKYSSGKSLSVFTSSSVASGKICSKVTLSCKTEGNGKNKKFSWFQGAKKVSSSNYYAQCQVTPAVTNACPVGQKRVSYTHSDADLDNFYQKSSGSLCVHQQALAPFLHNGVRYNSNVLLQREEVAECDSDSSGQYPLSYTHIDRDLDGHYVASSGRTCVSNNATPGQKMVEGSMQYYTSNIAANKIEVEKCDKDRFGKVLVSYGAVDRDGDGYYYVGNGEICLANTTLPAQKIIDGRVETYAKVAPSNKVEPNFTADLDPNLPEAQPKFHLVAPSVEGSGQWNGVDFLTYDRFELSEDGKQKFYYQNSSQGEGTEVFSIVGGSGIFQYSVTSGHGWIDGSGNFQFNCGVMVDEVAIIQIRDQRSWQIEEYRVYSNGDDSSCQGGGTNPNPGSSPSPTPSPTPTPTPTPTPEEERCQPPALNAGELPPCQYPQENPTPIRGCMDPASPYYNPEATEDDGSCEEKESKCPSEENDKTVTFDSVPGNTVVTVYGYEGDPYWDSASAAGVSSCTAHADLDGNGRKDRVDYLYDVLQPSGDKQAVQDWLNGVLNKNYAPASHFLKNGDIALSPDLSGRFNCGDIIEVKVKTGEDSNGKPTFQCFTGRVWDKTADYLSGRVDIYSPSGSHDHASKEVVGVRVTK